MSISHHQSFIKGCSPAVALAGADDASARDLIAWFLAVPGGVRSLPPNRTAWFRCIANAATAGDSFESAVKHTFTAILVLHFLFGVNCSRTPMIRAPSTASANTPGLAAFPISFGFDARRWLSALADQGVSAGNLGSQVRRTLRDPKARARPIISAGQWLGLRTLGILEPDQQNSASNEELRRSMRAETEQFFNYIVAEDRPVMDFLLADYTFLIGTLARHYGVPGPGRRGIRLPWRERNDRDSDAGEHPDPDLRIPPRRRSGANGCWKTCWPRRHRLLLQGFLNWKRAKTDRFPSTADGKASGRMRCVRVVVKPHGPHRICLRTFRMGIGAWRERDRRIRWNRWSPVVGERRSGITATNRILAGN